VEKAGGLGWAISDQIGVEPQGSELIIEIPLRQSWVNKA
jgi:signal transduction histidine kinase